MNRYLLITSIVGGVTIILGAFGAHALQEILDVNQLKSFETGVRYQMYHVLALFFVNTYGGFTEKNKIWISNLFILGIIMFSGSIFAITFGIEAKYLWFVTPIGGLLFILGWFLMAILLMIKRK